MKFLEVQDATQFLADDEVIGKDVVNVKDEKVGTIADLVMDQDQKLVGAVLSVGGIPRHRREVGRDSGGPDRLSGRGPASTPADRGHGGAVEERPRLPDPRSVRGAGDSRPSAAAGDGSTAADPIARDDHQAVVAPRCPGPDMAAPVRGAGSLSDGVAGVAVTRARGARLAHISLDRSAASQDFPETARIKRAASLLRHQK